MVRQVLRDDDEPTIVVAHSYGGIVTAEAAAGVGSVRHLLKIQTQAADHLARQSVHVTRQPVGAAAWQEVPTTYLVCAQDRGTPARLQRDFARRAGSVVELDTGHHPFLSQPAAIRELLLSL